MSDTVIYSVADGVATILLNRPQVMNALDARGSCSCARLRSGPSMTQKRARW